MCILLLVTKYGDIGCSLLRSAAILSKRYSTVDKITLQKLYTKRRSFLPTIIKYTLNHAALRRYVLECCLVSSLKAEKVVRYIRDQK